jgi:protocatechuate 3,4-dioxygenase beta subunit
MTGLRSLVLLAFLLSSPAISQEMASQDRPELTPLCAPDEPGEKLEFWGRVLDYQGRPLAKASVVAYHADRVGLYTAQGATNRVPRLRNVAVTDSAGRFGFVTIRPGAYPDGSQPAHIHLAVTAPAHDVRHLETWFRGDPLITPALAESAQQSASTVIVELARDPDGTWTFQQDIRLEAN